MTQARQNREYSIGMLAKRAATKVQTIRFYEQEGLMPAPPRTEGRQRRYTKAHADRLAFIRHARELGFPLESIRELLALADRPDLPCEKVDRVARNVLGDVEAKIARIQSLRRELKRMLESCGHGQVGDCRVIAVLADHTHRGCLTHTH